MGLASSQAEPSTFAWRWPIALQGLFTVIILFALPFLPESPRWMISHGRVEEAVEVFARLEGPNTPLDHPEVVRQRDDIVESIEEEHRIGKAAWTEVFTEGKLRNLSRVLLGVGPYLYIKLQTLQSTPSSC
jgi:Sugar (and other) transporter